MLAVVWSANNMVTVAILGGGISGLSAAYYLGKLAKSQAISKVNSGIITNYRPWPCHGRHRFGDNLVFSFP